MRLPVLGLNILLAGALPAATWHLPLPADAAWRPLAELPGWRISGVHSNLEASASGLRTTAARDALASHAMADGSALVRANGVLKVFLAVAGRIDTAVWVGLGDDLLDPNGVLDGIECRLLLGLDHGRWGLRQSALGETVWAAASLPPDGGACSLEVRLDSATGQLLAVTVDDGEGVRHLESMLQLDLGWDGLFAPGPTNWWRAVRVETRGAGAELHALQIGYATASLLIVR